MRKALDFVSSETRFDGTEVSYSYDTDGNLASVVYPDDTLSFTYDTDGLRTLAVNSAGTVTNRYGAATGWLDSTRGVDGMEVAYARSNGGSVTSVVSVAGTTAYVRDRADSAEARTLRAALDGRLAACAAEETKHNIGARTS